jgi:hypothetical protein
MKRRTTVISLTLLSILAGCEGGGGSAPKRFKFRTFNVSPCRQFQADVDLEAADAILARLADGSPDCSLSGALEGCDSLFEEVDESRRLHVTIANCDIPLNTGLFECGFTQAEVDSLEAAVHPDCDCRYAPRCELNSVCDQSPPVCVNEEGGVVGCESCGNGIDDNGNGDIDCADENCHRTEVCGFGWTTVTCTNTILDSTTLPATTTLLPPTTSLPPDGCEVVFRATDAVTFGALEWFTTYSGGSFAGTGASVECTSLVSGALAAFSDNDATKTLDSGLISLDGFTGPLDVATCTFVATETPSLSNFNIVVFDASGPDLKPIEPAPEIVVASIDCGVGATPALQIAPRAD